MASASGRVAQLVRALVSHTRGPGFESLRDHFPSASAQSSFPRVKVGSSMHALIRRSIPLAALLVAAPLALLAQRPSPAEARLLLQTRPDLVAQLRQRLVASGLTPDQVRARLRAEGYPEDLLDAYLPNATGPAAPPGDDVFSAVTALGITDSTDVQFLRYSALCEPQPVQRQLGQQGWQQPSYGRGGRGTMTTDTLLDSRLSERVPEERRAPFAGDSLGVATTRPPECDYLDPYGMSRETRALADRERGFRPPAERSDSAIFGLDIFRQSTSQFEPNLAGPVDPSYRLGPGDRLVLILTGDVELAHSLEVTREGFVVIPQVGQLFVANLTMEQLEDLLFSRLRRAYSGIGRGPGSSTRFSVSVARLRSNQVFVIGDVARPSSYRISSAGTALTALYAAGGPTETGSLRRIEVKRGGQLVASLDLYDYLLHGDARSDVRLETGDVVFVPVHGPRVRLTGEVIRPAIYELKPGETLADLIGAAGGFKPTAARRRVQIERILPPAQRNGSGGHDRVVIDIAADPVAGNGHGPAYPLEAGDVVRVFPVSNRVRNRINVRGSVWAPGSQGFEPGMTLSEAVKLAGGIKPDAYLGQILISRLLPDSTRVQLRSAFRDTTGAVANDLALQEDDDIRIFSVAEFRPTRYVAISGAVRKGGRYPYRAGMTMRDLVLMAGGLEESAYLGEAEVARLPENRAGGVTATTFRVQLDSSYLFERGPDGRYFGPPGLPAPSGSAPPVELEPYDNVLVLQQPDWELQRTVFLGGEVEFPGRYALVSKSERIADLIARAGGLTSEAYAEGVFFYRKNSRLGRIGLDLPQALRNRRHNDNLLLQDGDSVLVPRYNAVVNVTGAVNSPVAVAYVPGQDVAFYVRAAGGPSRTADMKRTYVTQPNGKVESIQRRPLLPDGVPKPRPGSHVYVPERDPEDKKDYVAITGGVAQILASVVAVLAIVLR